MLYHFTPNIQYGIISMATLIQIPSATFILTYIGACEAGIKLLRPSKLGVFLSYISLILSVIVFAFVWFLKIVFNIGYIKFSLFNEYKFHTASCRFIISSLSESIFR